MIKPLKQVNMIYSFQLSFFFQPGSYWIREHLSTYGSSALRYDYQADGVSQLKRVEDFSIRVQTGRRLIMLKQRVRCFKFGLIKPVIFIQKNKSFKERKKRKWVTEGTEKTKHKTRRLSVEKMCTDSATLTHKVITQWCNESVLDSKARWSKLALPMTTYHNPEFSVGIFLNLESFINP